jgi:hypothetical protein
VKKGSHLVGAAKKRFLGHDHHDVVIRANSWKTASVACREPGAEALE